MTNKRKGKCDALLVEYRTKYVALIADYKAKRISYVDYRNKGSALAADYTERVDALCDLVKI